MRGGKHIRRRNRRSNCGGLVAKVHIVQALAGPSIRDDHGLEARAPPAAEAHPRQQRKENKHHDRASNGNADYSASGELVRRVRSRLPMLGRFAQIARDHYRRDGLRPRFHPGASLGCHHK
jgi:hypothetical protein